VTITELAERDAAERARIHAAITAEVARELAIAEARKGRTDRLAARLAALQATA
jgi:hypothetical protein